MSFGWILGIAILGALIGFIILQRRRPSDADKIADALDKAAKDAEKKVTDAAASIFKKKP